MNDGIPSMRSVTAIAAHVTYAGALALLVVCELVLFAAMASPLPEALTGAPRAGIGGGGAADFEGSTRVLDRHGALIREVRSDRDDRAAWVPLGEVSAWVPKALLAAEDRRFYDHHGVDPIAVVRATVTAVRRGRVTSGASTLSQQLARVLDETPRTFAGKLDVVATAVRIERELDKDQILEQYLNHVSFGLGTRGIEAASRAYFDKPSSDLSLAEAASLASIPRGPAVYDPVRGSQRLAMRREWVLSEIESAGWASAGEIERARREALTLTVRRPGGGAEHFVRALMAGKLDAAPISIEADPRPEGRPREIETTLDFGLQREVAALAASTVASLREKEASAASVVVIDNASGDLLAYVGSHDLFDEAGLGHNDGILARRQPGSTLKPFLYELAIEKLGMTPATLLPDVDLSFPSPTGVYRPQNYDGRYHGPVRLREALANSFNVPAVWTAMQVGEHAVVRRLNQLGLDLHEGAGQYGVAIALGDAEVRLIDLAGAYATLARGGVHRPVRAVLGGTRSGGAPLKPPPGQERRIMEERAAYLVTHMLADDRARIESFGAHGVLDLPFPVAVKTGTSKGFRDNLTLGFTERLTVAVWVGNFDGSPMHGVSGVSGAGPLFRDVMIAAERRIGGSTRVAARPSGLFEAEVCPLSGKRPGRDCPHRVRELFAGPPPHGTCDMHVTLDVHHPSGLLAGPGCAQGVIERRRFEVYPADLTEWAVSVGRPLPPRDAFPGCPVETRPVAGARPSVVFPTDGARFVLDPSAGAPSAIVLAANVSMQTQEVFFVMDGVRLPAGLPARLEWRLTPGEHELSVLGDGIASAPVRFSVD